MELVVAVNKVASLLPTHEKYELASQLRRASVSVPANIAEGNRRWHRKHPLLPQNTGLPIPAPRSPPPIPPNTGSTLPHTHRFSGPAKTASFSWCTLSHRDRIRR
ncbi:MAG: four helix bundle protein [Gemmatimonadota bacterium]|nr:four helix bundle protein [Gemmatimonadota bacterium]